MLQFSARIYTPLSVRGLDAWAAGEGSYWGHNAIARVPAFMEHCDLPVLEGKPPLGGEILCHDIVEAALMRRGGLQVRILPDLDGSWEEMPTNLLDFVARERRWCEGNLQHARVLAADGLHWVSRLHLGLGVVGYLTAPLSLAFLTLTALQLALFPDPQGSAAGFELLTLGLFKEGAGLHPLLWLTLLTAILPRALILAAALQDRATTRAQGGSGRVVGGLALEQAFSTLMMSVTPVITCGFIWEVLTGRPSGWRVQARSDRGLSWGEAWANLRAPTLIGGAWGAAALAISPLLFLWTLPTTVGLLTAVPLAVWTSRLDLGRRARARGWFLIPEETSPPAEIAALQAIARGEAPAAPAPARGGPVLTVPPVQPARMRPQRLRWTPDAEVREEAA
jgi:membrane glycosyltransferase